MVALLLGLLLIFCPYMLAGLPGDWGRALMKMKKRPGFWLAASLVVIALVAGCSRGSLDRKSAAKAIQERFNDDISGILLHVGRVGPHCSSLDYRNQQSPIDLTPGKSVETTVAQLAGYIDVKPDGPDYWQVTLTPKGKTAMNMERLKFGDDHNTLNACDYRGWAFALASMEVVQVTGISSGQEKGSDLRIAEFQWRWKPTELGEMLRENGSIYQKLTPDQRKELKNSVFNPTDPSRVEIPVPPDDATHSVQLPFKKYDDGWRLQAPPKMSERR
jgi:hypothetical protein